MTLSRCLRAVHSATHRRRAAHVHSNTRAHPHEAILAEAQPATLDPRPSALNPRTARRCSASARVTMTRKESYDRHGSYDSSRSTESSRTVRGPFRSRPPVSVSTKYPNDEYVVYCPSHLLLRRIARPLAPIVSVSSISAPALSRRPSHC